MKKYWLVSVIFCLLLLQIVFGVNNEVSVLDSGPIPVPGYPEGMTMAPGTVELYGYHAKRNDSGNWATAGTVWKPDSEKNFHAVVLIHKNKFYLVAAEGEIAPGTGGKIFGSVLPVAFSDAGLVFSGVLSGPGVNKDNDSGFWTAQLVENSDGSVEIITQLLFREGDLSPMGEAYSAHISDFKINNNGKIVFILKDDSGFGIGIFQGEIGSSAISVLVKTGDIAPSVLSYRPEFKYLGLFNLINLTEDGVIVFSSTFAIDPNVNVGTVISSYGGGYQSGLWSIVNGEVRKIFISGEKTSFPSGSGFDIGLFGLSAYYTRPIVNKNGQIGILAYLVPIPKNIQSSYSADDVAPYLDSGNDSVLIVGNVNGGWELVERENRPEDTYYEVIGFNDDGEFLLKETTSSGSFSYKKKLNSTTVLSDNQQAPGAPNGVKFKGIVSPKFNSQGDVIFRAGLSGVGVNEDNNYGYWLHRNGVTKLVARMGEYIYDPADVEKKNGILVKSIFFKDANQNGDLLFEIRNSDTRVYSTWVYKVSSSTLHLIMRNGYVVRNKNFELQTFTYDYTRSVFINSNDVLISGVVFPIIEKDENYFKYDVKDTLEDGIIDIGADTISMGPNTGTLYFDHEHDDPQVIIPLSFTSPPLLNEFVGHTYLYQGSTNIRPHWYFTDKESNPDLVFNLNSIIGKVENISNNIENARYIDIIRPKGNAVSFRFDWDNDTQSYETNGYPTGINSNNNYKLVYTKDSHSSWNYILQFGNGTVHRYSLNENGSDSDRIGHYYTGGISSRLTYVGSKNGISRSIGTGSSSYTGVPYFGFSLGPQDMKGGKYLSPQFDINIIRTNGRITQIDYTTRGTKKEMISTELLYDENDKRIIGIEKFHITNIDADEPDRLEINDWFQNYSEDENIITTGDFLKTKKVTEGLTSKITTTFPDDEELVETTTFNQNGYVVDETVKANDSTATTTYAYNEGTGRYSSGVAKASRISQINHASGMIEKRRYHFDTGWIKEIETPYENGTLDSPLGVTKAVRYDYNYGFTEGDPADTSSLIEFPRVTTTLLNASVASKTYFAHHNTSYYPEYRVVTRQASTPGESYADAAEHETIVYPNRLANLQTPSGKTTAFFSSWKDNKTRFEIGTSYRDAEGNEYAKTTEVFNLFGQRESYVRKEIQGEDSFNTDFAISLPNSEVPEVDAFGRILKQSFMDGSSIKKENLTFSSGPKKVIDRTGVSTFFTYDFLGRVKTEESLGVSKHYEHDVLGNVIRTEKTASELAPIIEEAKYDIFSRPVLHIDPENRITTYGYTIGNNVIKTTAHLPNDGFQMKTHHFDGRLSETFGNAAILSKRVYIPYSGGIIIQDSQNNGLDWVKTYHDMLGNVVKIDKSGLPLPQLMEYDNKGNLTKSISVENVHTINKYNAKNELIETYIDVNQNGFFENGTDRKKSYESTYKTTNLDDDEKPTFVRLQTTHSVDGDVTILNDRDFKGLKSWQVVGYSLNQQLPTYIITKSEMIPDYQNKSLTENILFNDGSLIQRFTKNGLLQFISKFDTDGTEIDIIHFFYDSFHRRNKVVYKNKITQYEKINKNNEIDKIIDPNEKVTDILERNGLGQPTLIQRPDGGTIKKEFNHVGQLLTEQGVSRYAKRLGYNNRGYLNKLSTFRSGVLDGDGRSDTEFHFDDQFELLREKIIDGDTVKSVTQLENGKPKTITKNNITIDYEYDPNTAELKKESYNNGSLEHIYEYNDRGLVKSVDIDRGVVVDSEEYTYHLNGKIESETFGNGNYTVIYSYDDEGKRTKIRIRNINFELLLSDSYEYDAKTKELVGVKNIFSHRFKWDTQTDNNHKRNVYYGLDSNWENPAMKTVRFYHPVRPIINKLITESDLISGKTIYYNRAFYDENYKRKKEIISFKIPHSTPLEQVIWEYKYYNFSGHRTGELKSALLDRKNSAFSFKTVWKNSYKYDGIGNREKAGGLNYFPNNKNQYDSIALPAGVGIPFFISGYLPTVPNSPTTKTIVGMAHGDSIPSFEINLLSKNSSYFYGTKVLGISPSGPVNQEFTITTVDKLGMVSTLENTVRMSASIDQLNYTPNGELEHYAGYIYNWDEKGRLKSVSNQSVNNLPDLRIEFTYDHLDRRINKALYLNNILIKDILFIYDGQRLIAEIDDIQNKLIRTYTWGAGISGQMAPDNYTEGLYEIRDHDTDTSYFPYYDGRGNVVGLFRYYFEENSTQPKGEVVANYEYTPFGRFLTETKMTNVYNPFRHSTKYYDDDIDLYYYGLRYYSPRLGRWLNRDPYQEQGGLNLYAFNNNDPINYYDPNGGTPLHVAGAILAYLAPRLTLAAGAATIETYLTGGSWGNSFLTWGAASLVPGALELRAAGLSISAARGLAMYRIPAQIGVEAGLSYALGYHDNFRDSLTTSTISGLGGEAFSHGLGAGFRRYGPFARQWMKSKWYDYKVHRLIQTTVVARSRALRRYGGFVYNGPLDFGDPVGYWAKRKYPAGLVDDIIDSKRLNSIFYAATPYSSLPASPANRTYGPVVTERIRQILLRHSSKQPNKVEEFLITQMIKRRNHSPFVSLYITEDDAWKAFTKTKYFKPGNNYRIHKLVVPDTEVILAPTHGSFLDDLLPLMNINRRREFLTAPEYGIMQFRHIPGF